MTRSVERVKRRLEKKAHDKAEAKVRRHLDMVRDSRPCGECKECCTTLGVPIIEKPAGTPCPALIEKGCGIYTNRPKVCREFECMWRLGLFDMEGRPDKLGVMVDVNLKDSKYGADMFVVRELRDGGIDAAMPRLMELSAEGHLIYLVQGDKRRMMGPEEKVKAAMAFAQEQLDGE